MKHRRSILLFTLILIMMTGCDEPVTDDLSGTAWILDELVKPFHMGYLPQGIRLQFNDNMELNGYAGSTEINGIYNLEASSITIDLYEPEGYTCAGLSSLCTYYDALQDVSNAEITDDQLTLFSGDSVEIKFHAAVIDPALLDRIWELDTLTVPGLRIMQAGDTLTMITNSGDTTRATYSTLTTIEFKRDSRIVGMLVCDLFSGTYDITTGGDIVLRGWLFNEPLCGSAQNMASYIDEALKQITRYESTDSSLVFRDAGGNTTMRYGLRSFVVEKAAQK